MNNSIMEEKINSLIAKRWSPRAFDGQPVMEEQMTRLLEAARRAASNYNIQPWRFIYAHKTDEESYQQIFDALMEPNQIWADSAPVLMTTIARTHNNAGDPNAHSWHDVGLAMGNLTMQAMHEGLYVHQMGGYYGEKAKQNLDIPEGFEPVAMVAIGYPGDPEQLPDDLKQAEISESEREPLANIVFKGQWGSTPSHLKS